MRDRNSVTVSGGRCKKRRRWCRELKWGSIFCGRCGGAATAMTRASSRKRNFLSSEVTARNSNSLFLFLFLVREPASQNAKLKTETAIHCGSAPRRRGGRGRNSRNQRLGQV